MSIHKPLAVVATLFWGLGLSHPALAQAQAPVVAPSNPGPPVPATPTVAPATQSPPPAPAAPPPGAQAAVPPGYMLVPVPDSQPKTAYDVQYPQVRGALPPGMELPYEDGDPIPAGYRLRRQPRRGLLIAGAIVTGVPWVISVTAATGADFDNKSGFLLVPGVGPWLALLAGAGKDRDCGTEFCNADKSGLRAALVLDGLVQSAGAAIFIIGIAVPRKRLVRDDVTLSFLPTTLGNDGYGLGAVGTF